MCRLELRQAIEWDGSLILFLRKQVITVAIELNKLIVPNAIVKHESFIDRHVAAWPRARFGSF